MEEAIGFALDKRAILLIGSGFNFGAISNTGEAIPTSHRLTEILDEGYLEPSDDYREAAQRFLDDKEKGGPGALYARMKPHFTVKTVSEWHSRILSVPWKNIYTTNYDNVVEHVLGDSAWPINAATDSKKFIAEKTNVVHMNGRLLEPKDIEQEHFIRLSESSYLTQKFKDSDYHLRFRNDLYRERALFVVGYTIPDLDIGMLLKSVPDPQTKIHLICNKGEKDKQIKKLKNYGNVHPVGVEEFANAIARVQRTHQPRSATANRYCIRKFESPSDLKPPGDKDRWDLYVSGDFNLACFRGQHDTSNHRPYAVTRTRASEVATAIKSGTRLIGLYGQLASGKSILCEQIALILDESTAFDVYFVERQGATLHAELEEVCRSAARQTVIIFEGSERFTDEIASVLMQYDSLARVIVTGRTPVFLSTFPILTRRAKINHAISFEIDDLDKKEVRELAGVLQGPELSSPRIASMNQTQIEEVILKKCNGEIRDVLVMIFESESVRQRILSAHEALQLSDAESEALLLCFVARVLDLNIRIYEMADGFCSSGVPAAFWSRQDVRAFLKPDSGDLLKCSPALAQFFVRTVYNAGSTRLALEKISRKLYQMRNDPDYEEYFSSCMKFGKIRELFHPKSQHTEAVAFYDEMKGSAIAKAVPYFWLQYAIARWSNLDWGLSRQFLESARKVAAGQKGFRPFQIDNFDAKMRMEAHLRGIKTGCTISEDFQYARKVLGQQLSLDETRDHPLRLAEKMLELAEKLRADGKNDGKQEISELTTAIKHLLDDAPCALLFPIIARRIAVRASRLR